MTRTTRTRWLSLVTLTLLVHSSLLASPARGKELVDFETWTKSCLAAPANRTLQGRIPGPKQLPIKDFEVVRGLANDVLKHFQKSDLANTEHWLGEKPTAEEFFDTTRTYYTRASRIPFQPFTQKVKVPVGSKVIFHGDFHGDIRSFISTLVWLNKNGILDGFKFKQPDTYFVFLGDYVDRGSYGVEVLYTLMRLKLANPEHVMMVRGNHEDYELTATYGFLREGGIKYGRAFDPLPLWRMYDFLPVVIYLGAGDNFVQCNHGGMEPGYDAKPLLAAKGNLHYQMLGKLKQREFARQHPDWLGNASKEAKAMANEKLADFVPLSPTEPQSIGFMWNDFFVFGDDPILGFNSSRLAFNHGKQSTKYLLTSASSASSKLRAVFRAHQHSSVPTPAMNRIVASKGAFRHWQKTDSVEQAKANRQTLQKILELDPGRRVPEGSVWTLNVSPDSMYGAGNNYTFDTIGILTLAESFDAWRLKVVNIPVKTAVPK